MLLYPFHWQIVDIEIANTREEIKTSMHGDQNMKQKKVEKN